MKSLELPIWESIEKFAQNPRTQYRFQLLVILWSMFILVYSFGAIGDGYFSLYLLSIMFLVLYVLDTAAKDWETLFENHEAGSSTNRHISQKETLKLIKEFKSELELQKQSDKKLYKLVSKIESLNDAK